MTDQIKIAFTLYGRPATQGSKSAAPVMDRHGRPVLKNGRPVVRMFEANERLPAWRQEVAAAAVQVYGGPLLVGAVRLDIAFRFPRAAGHFGTGRNEGKLKPSAPQFHVIKPDTLKLARAVEDALTGVIYRDDRQVVSHTLDKEYGPRYETHVVVTSLDGLTEKPF